MKIIVEGKEIETRDIVRIKEAGFRTHGFIIQLTENREMGFTKKENYDSSLDSLREINNRYRRLREAVESKWKEDKNDIPVFNL